MIDRNAPPVSTLRSYFELLRVPNLLTAIADSAMGFLFVQPMWAWSGLLPDAELLPRGWLVLGLLALISSMLYGSGVVLNDLFDYPRDLEDRPERPLPSGRISRRAARWLGWELMFVGTALACTLSVMLRWYGPAGVAVLLAAAIAAYNAGLKRTPLGPLVMGSCRMLNVLLGMSVLAGPLHAEHWVVAGGIGLYVAGITWLARDEERRSQPVKLAAATLVMLGGIGLLASLPYWAGDRLLMIRDPLRWYLIMGMVAGYVGIRCVPAILEPSPGLVRAAVTRAIAWLVFLDAVACYANCGMSWAVGIMALMIPVVLLSRWFRST